VKVWTKEEEEEEESHLQNIMTCPVLWTAINSSSPRLEMSLQEMPNWLQFVPTAVH